MKPCCLIIIIILNFSFACETRATLSGELARCQTENLLEHNGRAVSLRPYLLNSIATRCQGSVGSIVGLVPGVLSLSPGETVAGAHQGRHSKSAQYRRMKAEWKSNVYLARSRIQVRQL